MGRLPEDDANPHRHAYGDYTHTSANGRYRFEWTPFRPAIEAWENAQHYLRAALEDLAEAQKLPGFGLNGLGDEHQHMMGALQVLAEHTQGCHRAAGNLVKIMEVADADYARAHEDSYEQYKELTGIVDLVREGQVYVRADADAAEIATDQRLDREVFPFDGQRD